MATTVALFVSFEVSSIDTFVLVGFLTGFWHWTLIAVIGMEAVVHLAAEVVMTVKPRACADEDSSDKPLRTVVTGWGTSVGSRHSNRNGPTGSTPTLTAPGKTRADSSSAAADSE